MSDSPEKIYLTGYLRVSDENLSSVLKALPTHIALTRAEKGCLKFEVTQNSDNPNQLDVSEIFENQAAFDAHNKRTKLSDWAVVTQGIERNFQIKTGNN